MHMKQKLLPLGSSAPTLAAMPRLEESKDRAESEEIGAIGTRPRSRSFEVARGTYGANPSLSPHHPPQRKTKAIRLRELQTLVPFPASTLRRMTRVGIFVKAARRVAPARKWSRGAIEPGLAGPHLEVSWPASDAYGTDYDTDPEIRSHMRAILSGSTKPSAPVRA